MKLKWNVIVLLGLMLALFVQPVAAADSAQGTGGIHFGPYTLDSGNRITEDLVVFGGPVTIEDDAVFDADLTVFGPTELEDGARVEGQLVIFGSLDVRGTVDGDVFCAGTVTLDDGAYIYGNLDAAGTISQDEGAVVDGEITTIDEGDFEWTLPFDIPGSPAAPSAPAVSTATPLWIRWITGVFKAMAGVVILTLVALLIASIWPEQMQRVAGTIEDNPLPTFGVGLLSLIVTGVAMILLIITLCLSLFAVVGMIFVGLALLVGWVAMGYILGQRFMRAVAPQATPNVVVDAVIGTALVSLLMAVTQVFGPLQALLQFVLLPVAAGAVVLTRFGTRPYMARSGTPGVVMPSGDPGDAPVAAPSVFVAPDVSPLVEPEPEPVPPVNAAEVPPPLPDIEAENADDESAE